EAMEVAGDEFDAPAGCPRHPFDRSEEPAGDPKSGMLQKAVGADEQAPKHRHLLEVRACPDGLQEAGSLPDREPAEDSITAPHQGGSLGEGELRHARAAVW